MFVSASYIANHLLPNLKNFIPAGEFRRAFGTYLALLSIFGTGLLTFILIITKIHKRSILSFISTSYKFSWLNYWRGFLIWGALVFGNELIIEYHKFDYFINHFNLKNFVILLTLGFISIGVQSFFEEIFIRGYLLQGMSLRIKI